jgi:hypothetical protein
LFLSIHYIIPAHENGKKKKKRKRLYRRTQIPAAIRADGWNDFSANEQKKNLSMKTAKKKKKLGRRKRPWPFKGFPLQQLFSCFVFFYLILLLTQGRRKERKKEKGRPRGLFCLFKDFLKSCSFFFCLWRVCRRFIFLSYPEKTVIF